MELVTYAQQQKRKKMILIMKGHTLFNARFYFFHEKVRKGKSMEVLPFSWVKISVECLVFCSVRFPTQNQKKKHCLHEKQAPIGSIRYRTFVACSQLHPFSSPAQGFFFCFRTKFTPFWQWWFSLKRRGACGFRSVWPSLLEHVWRGVERTH